MSPCRIKIKHMVVGLWTCLKHGATLCCSAGPLSGCPTHTEPSIYSSHCSQGIAKLRLRKQTPFEQNHSSSPELPSSETAMETGDLSPPGASFLGLLAVTLGALLAAGIAFRRAARLRREGSAVQLLSRLPHGPCKARSGFEEGAQKGLLFRVCRPKQPKHPSSVPSNPLERIQHPLYDARCVVVKIPLRASGGFAFGVY